MRQAIGLGLLLLLFLGVWPRATGRVVSRALTKPHADDHKLEMVAALLDRVLVEARESSIETVSLVGTNESFFRDVIDRLAASRHPETTPLFNNAVGRRTYSHQLVLVGGDNLHSIMGSLVGAMSFQPTRFFCTNVRTIHVMLLLSDLRFVESRKFLLLRMFFCTISYLVVVPSPLPNYPPILMTTDFYDRLVMVPHDAPMSLLFTDRLRIDDLPTVNVLSARWVLRMWQNQTNQATGPDWMVVRTILEYMGVRWKLRVHRHDPSLTLVEWINEQLARGVVDIYIDRNFMPDARSVAHYLPEMNGICMVLPKAKKYDVLQHLLRPMQTSSWIALCVGLLVGSLLTERFCRNSLLTALLFGVNLNSPAVSRTERTALFCSLVLFFVLSEAYQAKLLSLMSTQRYPSDPRTVAEFLSTDLMLELGETTAAVVSIRPEFIGRVTNTTDYAFTFDGHQDYGVAMHCSYAWEQLVLWARLQYKRHGHNVRPGVHVVSEKLLSMPAMYTFSSEFLLYPRFREYLNRLFESGLVEHWQEKTGGQQHYEWRFEFMDSTILSFGDLKMIWSVLGVGHALASVVFAAELSSCMVKRFCWPRRGNRNQAFE